MEPRKEIPWPHKPRQIGQIDSGLRQAIRDLVTGVRPWPLFLFGSPGTGKTCAVLSLVDHCPFSMFFTTEEWSQSWSDVLCGRKEDSDGTKILADHWRKAVGKWSLLALDDAGTRDRVSDASYEVFKMALDLREGKPLVVTSNHPLPMISTLYDARIKDRFEAGTVIELVGKSRRQGGS